MAIEPISSTFRLNVCRIVVSYKEKKNVDKMDIELCVLLT